MHSIGSRTTSAASRPSHRERDPLPREVPREAARDRSGRRVAGSVLALLGAIALGTQDAAAQGLGYTITPAATNVRWDGSLGLEHSTLIGGQLGFDFERYVSLQGYYFTNNGLRTAIDKLGLTSDLAGRLANQKLDVRSYGANLVLNLGTGMIVPFVKGGGGVLEFRPQTAATGTVSAGTTRQAALTVGGGLQLAILGPVRLDVFAEDLMFRVNRYALAAQVNGAPTGSGLIPPDPEQTKTRHNVTLGAGLAIPFGPAREKERGPSQLYQWGLSGASFALEPMVGRLFFGDGQDIGDQDVAGLRAGFDMGRLVGLRGFYWRGTNSGFTRTEPMQSWGAEAQLRLNSGPGITPFLLLGGARLDFKDAFRSTNGGAVNDENSLIAGGGVSFPIAERLALNVSARDYIYSQSTLDSVTSLSELRSNLRNNWLISAGLRFSVGGQSGRNLAERRDREARAREVQDARVALADSLRIDSLSRSRSDTARTRADSLVIVSGNDTLRVPRGDTVRVREELARRTRNVSRSGDSTAARDFTTERLMTIPVPSEGEVYVRYGPTNAPGTRLSPRNGQVMAGSEWTEAELRDATRAILREEVAAEWARTDGVSTTRPRARSQAPRLDDARLAAIEQRVTERVTAMQAGRPAQSDTRVPLRKEAVEAAPTQPSVTLPTTDAEFDARVDARLAERIDQIVDRRVREELARQPQATPAPRAAPATTIPTTTVRVDTMRLTVRESTGEVAPRRLGLTRLTAYSGSTLRGGTQALLGARADLGPIGRAGSAIHFVPELALGFGAGARSTMLAANAMYMFPTFQFGRLPGIAPHAGAGLGLLNFSDPVRSRDGLEAVLNLQYGATVDLWRRSASSVPALLVEHQGVDLFDLNRLLIGLTWRF